MMNVLLRERARGPGRLVLLGAAVLIALLVVNGLIFFNNIRTLRTQEQAVTQSQRVLSAVDETRVTMIDAETGQRGYLLTGRDSYLAPYTIARNAIDGRLTLLKVLTADDPMQQSRLPRLRLLMKAKFAELASTIMLRRAGKTGAAFKIVLSDRGKRFTDEAASILEAMRTTELVLLRGRAAASATATTAAAVTLVLATALAVALLIGLVFAGVRIVRWQAQLLQQEETGRTVAEEAVATRDTFLSLAAHELKTPLTALVGNAQLLQRRLSRQEGANERDLHSVNMMTESAKRLQQLVEQLLDLSRLQRGQLALTLRPFDLAALVRRVTVELQSTTTHHEIVVEDAVADEQLLVGDALRLEQVLRNLVQNAVKYSPAGGRITVTTTRVGDRARVEVADGGIGIPAADLAHLFDRFYRATNADSHSFDGLGMGLYVVKEVVTAHSGALSVTSTEGEGSTFRVDLPLAGPAVDGATVVARQTPAFP